MAYESIEVASGVFIGWGEHKGQHVTGKVLDYDEYGGNDFGKNQCPLLEVELTERAASFNKAGVRTDHDPGTVVLLTCGLTNLKKKIKRADLHRGDQVKITLSSFLSTSNGTMKEFTVQVDRSGRDAHESASHERDDDEPPF